MGQLPLNDCERIRGYAAWSVDGELSEMEAAALYVFAQVRQKPPSCVLLT